MTHQTTKPQTLEELIEELERLDMHDQESKGCNITLAEWLDRDNIDILKTFIKKVYEAGGEAERERKGNFKPIINHSCTNPVSCPWCNSESIKVIIATT